MAFEDFSSEDLMSAFQDALAQVTNEMGEGPESAPSLGDGVAGESDTSPLPPPRPLEDSVVTPESEISPQNPYQAERLEKPVTDQFGDPARGWRVNPELAPYLALVTGNVNPLSESQRRLSEDLADNPVGGQRGGPTFGGLLQSLKGPLESMAQRRDVQESFVRSGNQSLLERRPSGEVGINWAEWERQAKDKNIVAAYPEATPEGFRRVTQYESGRVTTEKVDAQSMGDRPVQTASGKTVFWNPRDNSVWEMDGPFRGRPITGRERDDLMKPPRAPAAASTRAPAAAPVAAPAAAPATAPTTAPATAPAAAPAAAPTTAPTAKLPEILGGASTAVDIVVRDQDGRPFTVIPQGDTIYRTTNGIAYDHPRYGRIYMDRNGNVISMERNPADRLPGFLGDASTAVDIVVRDQDGNQIAVIPQGDTIYRTTNGIAYDHPRYGMIHMDRNGNVISIERNPAGQTTANGGGGTSGFGSGNATPGASRTPGPAAMTGPQQATTTSGAGTTTPSPTPTPSASSAIPTGWDLSKGYRLTGPVDIRYGSETFRLEPGTYVIPSTENNWRVIPNERRDGTIEWIIVDNRGQIRDVTTKRPW
jgi:hypothetical protein